ncbi:MAG: glutamate--tRNA ligase [Candidatus Omnitrophica bacterium]|nr:glutamate--tRNA ligase [Candidatus Omnitrophota bacterium]MCM8826460.1 glutamate--tRNA ligase [Candidatus Omnitrophota bacterium]
MDRRLKVRFAPSPTGFLHIGSARTALFNWIFAKKYNAEFILRIEDTDRGRSKEEYLNEILDSLQWLGINWDKIYHQSQRLEIYKDYANKLVESKKAFVEDGAIIFRYELDSISFDDLIRGYIEFKELPKDTEVIIKSDGTPTYNFACCVDDVLLGITHVIRGEDHIPNTPKQLLMYRALNFTPPYFAHLPMILSSEGGKLSKRFGATSIREYRDAGYLPEAIVNYLLLLGWAPGKNREIVSMEEAVRLFELKNVNKTGAAFSLDKLDWVNSEYIKKLASEEFFKYAKEFLERQNFLPLGVEEEYVKKVILLFQNRISKLSDLKEWTYSCFFDNYTYSQDTQEILVKELSKEISFLITKLDKISSFDKITVEKEFRATAQELGLKAGDLVHPVRVALTGRRIGPGLFEVMEVLGKERVIKRLLRLLNFWQQTKAI